jgi:hypothetical protein
MRYFRGLAALLLAAGGCGSGTDSSSDPSEVGSTGASGSSLVNGAQGGGAAGSETIALSGAGGAGGNSTTGDSGNVITGANDAGKTTAPDAGATREAAPLVPVANCAKLPTKDAGWHSITPPQMAGLEALSVVVDPYDQSVYAAADSSTTPGTGVLRSTDCGATWNLASTGQNADTMKSGGLWAMMIEPSPGKAPTIYAANGYGNGPTIYRSTNGGVDFSALDPDPNGTVATGLPFVHSIGMDPKQPSHIAVAFHNNCMAPHSAVCFSRSFDRGDTWQIFDGPSELGGWEEGASINVLGPNSYLYIGNHGAFFTADTGATWKHVTSTAVYCCYPGITLQLPDGSLLAPIGAANQGIWISRAGAGELGANLMPLAGTPDQIISLITDGKRVYAGRGYFNLTQPYWSAPIDDLTKWTPMTTPTITRSPNEMAYDPVHHVIYSVNWGAGMWRLVTE